MKQTCPHCGAELPEEASFCPKCARSIQQPRDAAFPRFLPRRILWGLLAFAVLLCMLTALYFGLRPQTVDGLGSVLYTDRDGTYQLMFGWTLNDLEPQSEVRLEEEEGGDFRMPSRVFIRDHASGANATAVFMEKVESVSAEFLQEEGADAPISCQPPEHMQDYCPDAAWISLVDFICEEIRAQMHWTIHMKNGDEIHLRQNYLVTPRHVVEFHPGDVPMETVADLQKLMAKIAEERSSSSDIFRVFLPPITYTEEFRIRDGQFCSLIGTDGPDGTRTTFTNTLMIDAHHGPLLQVEHIDFRGNGTGVGVSTPCSLHIYDCRFSGWKTAVLGYGRAWVNIRASELENNQIGFHFNSEGGSVTHTQFNDNRFVGNETGILLERVPTETSISFDNTYFGSNGTDIENRCSHDIDISGAIFR